MKLFFLAAFSFFYFSSHACNGDVIACKGRDRISTAGDFSNQMQLLGITVPSMDQQVETPYAERFSIQIPAAEPPGISDIVVIAAPPRRGGEAQAPAPVGSSDNLDSTDQNQNNNPSPSPTGGAPAGANTASTGGGFTPPTTEIGGGSNLVGGLLYSDEEEEKVEEVKNENPESPIQNINPFQPAAVAENSGSKAKSKDSPTNMAAGGGGGSGLDNPFGSFSSGGGQQVAAAGGPEESASEEALKKMNSESGFFGASGGGSRGSRRGSSDDPNFAQSQGRKLASADKLKYEKLDAQGLFLNRYSRGLASAPEFGDKNTFLFFSICQHYDSYEKANSINFGSTQCPPKE